MAFVVNATSAEANQTSSLSILKPSGLANGDILFLVAGSGEPANGDVTIFPPTGFSTVIRTSTSSDTDRQTWIFSKIITDAGSEPASYFFSFANFIPMQMHLIQVRDADTSDHINATAGTVLNNAGGNIITPSITTNKNNCLILTCAFLTGITSAQPSSMSAPVGVTKMADLGPVPDSGNPWSYQVVGHYQLPTAGSTGTKTWTYSGGSAGDDNVAIQIAINNITSGGGSCTCNAICDSDCGSNQLCTGHVPICSNSFTFTNTPVTDSLIKAIDLLELQTAINNERTDSGRRFNASDPAFCFTHTPGNLGCTNNTFSAFSWTAGVEVDGEVLAQHYDDIKDANNEVVTNSGYGSAVTANFIAQSIDPINSGINAIDIVDLQTKINLTRELCICDSHCNCDPSDCGCNGECPSDDYYI